MSSKQEKLDLYYSALCNQIFEQKRVSTAVCFLPQGHEGKHVHKPYTNACSRCQKHNFTDAPMVHDHVWLDEAARQPMGDVLCLECLEAVLDRPLVIDDLTDAPWNDMFRAGWLRACRTRKVS